MGIVRQHLRRPAQPRFGFGDAQIAQRELPARPQSQAVIGVGTQDAIEQRRRFVGSVAHLVTAGQSHPVIGLIRLLLHEPFEFGNRLGEQAEFEEGDGECRARLRPARLPFEHASEIFDPELEAAPATLDRGQAAVFQTARVVREAGRPLRGDGVRIVRAEDGEITFRQRFPHVALNLRIGVGLPLKVDRHTGDIAVGRLEQRPLEDQLGRRSAGESPPFAEFLERRGQIAIAASGAAGEHAQIDALPPRPHGAAFREVPAGFVGPVLGQGGSTRAEVVPSVELRRRQKQGEAEQPSTAGAAASAEPAGDSAHRRPPPDAANARCWVANTGLPISW